MFLFKGVQSEERGGLLIFPKRRTSSSKYVAEFALVHPILFSSCNNNKNVVQNLMIKDGNAINSYSLPFYTEWNVRDESLVLYEASEGHLYQLVWKDKQQQEIPLCAFIIDNSYLNANQNIWTKVESLGSLCCKLFTVCEKYPELFMHSSNLSKHSNTTWAFSYQTLLDEAKINDLQLASQLSNFDIEKTLKIMPSIEDYLKAIQNETDKKKLGKICESYLEKLNNVSRVCVSQHCETLSCGFLAMCRLASNNIEPAKQLCALFLKDITHINKKTVPNKTSVNQFQIETNVKKITADFLSEYSLLTHCRDFPDEDERNSLFNNLKLLETREDLMFAYFPDLFRKERKNNNFSTLSATTCYKYLNSPFKFYDHKKIGAGIPHEIFYNAIISAKNGNVNCNNFFLHIIDNKELYSNNVLVWTSFYCTSCDFCNDNYQVEQYLEQVYNERAGHRAQAIKLIRSDSISNISKGYNMLLDGYLSYSDYSYSDTLGSLFMEGIEKIPKDYERALYWYSKDSSSSSAILKTKDLLRKGIKIEHEDSYFLGPLKNSTQIVDNHIEIMEDYQNIPKNDDVSLVI